MSGLEAALSALLARLADLDARIAIVGGLAVSARTEPRFTRDADVGADRLLGLITKRGYGRGKDLERELTDLRAEMGR